MEYEDCKCGHLNINHNAIKGCRVCECKQFNPKKEVRFSPPTTKVMGIRANVFYDNTNGKQKSDLSNDKKEGSLSYLPSMSTIKRSKSS